MRPDGTTSFTDADAGRLFMSSATGIMMVYDSAGDAFLSCAVSPVATQTISGLKTFASLATFSGNVLMSGSLTLQNAREAVSSYVTSTSFQISNMVANVLAAVPNTNDTGLIHGGWYQTTSSNFVEVLKIERVNATSVRFYTRGALYGNPSNVVYSTGTAAATNEYAVLYW